jgi:plasmid stabilization system protein ParE
MSRFEVRVAARALAEIQTISRWWVRHRPAAPRLFDQELDSMLDLLEIQPQIGMPRRLPRVGDVRVVVLQRSRQVVIYRIVGTEVWLLRVRHARRRPLRSAR